jgi:hypothetical protein
MAQPVTEPSICTHVTHRLHELTFTNLTDDDIRNILILFRQIEDNDGYIGDDFGRLNDMAKAFEKTLFAKKHNYMDRWT